MRGTRPGRRRARGFVLPITLILTGIIGVVVLSLLNKEESALRVSADMVASRRAFYAADGMGKAVVVAASNYMAGDPTPTSAELAASFTPSLLDSITPAGYARESFSISAVTTNPAGPLPSGPFMGMHSRQDPVTFSLRLRDNRTGAIGTTSQTVTLGQVGMFQFFIFSDDAFFYFDTSATLSIDGRVHANSDACLGPGNTGTITLSKITASGRIIHGDDSARCGLDYSGGASLWIKDGSGVNQTMTTANDNGCTNATCTGGWQTYALNRWGGNAQDVAHGVPELKLPVATPPATQAGTDVGGTAVRSNANTSRFLVDPPRSSDPADVLQQKLACQADIRIVNGIWFLRPTNPSDGCGWPGTPIWSDHPGARTTVTGEGTEGLEGSGLQVGQNDLFPGATALGVDKPQLYSHYETDPANGLLINNNTGNTGVISYGMLFRAGANNYTPGFLFWNNPGTSRGCSATNDSCFCQTCAGTGCGAPGQLKVRNALNWDVANGAVCTARKGGTTNAQLNVADQLLQGTRSGFVDGRVALDLGNGGRILPVNFDVAQFTTALNSVAAGTGELGTHFGGAGRPFNGIVYITNTWTGSMNGFPDAWPTSWPAQGTATQNDSNQVMQFNSGIGNQSLPFPLCSDTVSGTLTGTTGNAALFTGRACSYGGLGRPNAVRIINAANIPVGTFPKGLTIASNLPVYVLGDYNTSSTPGSSPWVPSLVAGDAITMLSNAWDDGRMSGANGNVTWDRDGSVNSGTTNDRNATVTTYNLQILAGQVLPSTSASGGGMNNFMRYLEDWGGGVQHRVNGSVVVGFSSVYAKQPFVGPNTYYTAPSRVWQFDTNLNAITNQPPGSPRYNVSATRQWSRTP
ncbi:MAG: hypothetical protein AB2A00_25470 [Myxococcota bacterium]